jgi:protein-S-isoprenylcysteine O-methyltransferase Ste14
MTTKMIFFTARPAILIIIIPSMLLLITPFQLKVWDVVGGLGLILCIVGTGLFLVSHWLVYRPDQWSAEQPLFGEPKRLVTHSLYHHVRNPNLLGIYFLLLGEASLFQSWPIFFFAILLAIPSVLQATTREESRLEQTFGDAYRKYKAEVPRFFPKTETGKRFVAVLLVVVVTLVTFKFL